MTERYVWSVVTDCGGPSRYVRSLLERERSRHDLAALLENASACGGLHMFAASIVGAHLADGWQALHGSRPDWADALDHGRALVDSAMTADDLAGLMLAELEVPEAPEAMA